MTGPSIQFKDVNLSLGGVSILEDISFSISAGDIHCIVGTNGGGKTSLIRCMLGQMPHAGNISMQWPGESRVIGYVPQSLEFDKTLPLSVADFMAMACQRRPAFLGAGKEIRPLVEAALDKVGLRGKHKRKLGSLSGGERQRVLLAQAMIPDPDLLVLDEPSAGLDAGGAGILEAIVTQYRENGVTVVWINHDMNQVKQFADSVTGVNRTIVLNGKPEDVLSSATAGSTLDEQGFGQSTGAGGAA
jgi:zinc transport system ATP-binding protein